MREYIVYRHEHNEANQPVEQGLPEKMPVLRVEADGPERACRLARGQVSVADNQYLSAELAADVDEKEALLNRTARASGAGEP